MIYLYLNRNQIKILALTKALLGQYSLSYFAKTHSSQLIDNKNLANVDVIASAIKEGLTSAQPLQITEKEVTVILPQELFSFLRFAIPKDISDTAIVPFIKDKARQELNIDIQDEYYDYILSSQSTETIASFYSLPKDLHQRLTEIFQLLQLKIVKIIPETLSYYTLFQKTLRKEKTENILYVSYGTESAFGYLFDSFGLARNTSYAFESNIKASLKKTVDALQNESIKINRLILSGEESKKVRQDLFTKEVGAWTNPLEKILDNFYQDYLKMLITAENHTFSILTYDVCLGAFIFSQEQKDFTLMKSEKNHGNGKKLTFKPPQFNIASEIFSLKTVLMFVISFIISFGIIFAGSRLSKSKIDLSFMKQSVKKVTPTTKPTPKPKASPTPSIQKEKLKIQVLNGSGTKGKANDVKEILLEAGYSDIITDNADSFDYTKTEVRIKGNEKAIFSLIQKDLTDHVKIGKSTELDKDETADIVIIIGTDFE
ncbi:hypothetical protein A2957_02345 [Candidatus Roizmanbacteria bacterium RIFCSPLOWO2_01_FULL_38_11]|uniref:LytR/CpsA/Psr regulator C-terminal domain-containing protein n=1 Tax=Candidatus Roizmanbacteria bacterium RIFCSPLOWO2_01_FULL_38_11 TaxID=1802060 RepID=A0A1F7IPN2_9BACT|nr:MAG: hypothetical protein A2957_02345 [Candidatus Roizmanbacteria bacterium RIFCSPLOWO2_01_FULL_38_11]